MSQMVAAIRASKKPVMSISGPFAEPLGSLGSNMLTLITFLRTVSVTEPPSRRAPANSKMAAIIQATGRVMEPAPTDVAKAFATSFAPIPHAIRKARVRPTTTIHSYLATELMKCGSPMVLKEGFVAVDNADALLRACVQLNVSDMLVSKGVWMLYGTGSFC